MTKILEIVGVTKHFGNLTVLRDVSFAIQDREIFGLIGPNGAGKTTLVNLITGMIPYSDGDILFFEKSIRGLKPHQIGRLGISRTYEIYPPLIKMTGMENVMVGALFGREGRKRSKEAGRRRALEVLDFLQLAGERDVPAEKLNVLERKRLELAIALATEPKLLILDEWMGGLNPAEIEKAVEVIQRVRNQGISILVIDHVMKAVANLSDRILLLHNGKKIMEGSLEAVLSNTLVIRAYLGDRYKELHH